MASWWRQQHPIIVRFIHKYVALLTSYFAPLTPRAARRAGYRCASYELLRSLDRVEADLPGGKRGCASRCRSRSWEERRERALCGGPVSIYRAVSGVGVMAVAVVFAAGGLGLGTRTIQSPTWYLVVRTRRFAPRAAYAARYACSGSKNSVKRTKRRSMLDCKCKLAA